MNPSINANVIIQMLFIHIHTIEIQAWNMYRKELLNIACCNVSPSKNVTQKIEYVTRVHLRSRVLFIRSN